MTGAKIFEKAVSYLEQSYSDSTDSADFSVHYLNLLAQEALPYENQVRAILGKPVLSAAPDISSLEDELEYCDDICRVAFPYGLASFLYSNDDEIAKSNSFRQRFVSALQDAVLNAVRVAGGEVLTYEGEDAYCSPWG